MDALLSPILSVVMVAALLFSSDLSPTTIEELFFKENPA